MRWGWGRGRWRWIWLTTYAWEGRKKNPFTRAEADHSRSERANCRDRTHESDAVWRKPEEEKAFIIEGVVQLWAIYKFLQNKQKKDSSFLYKRNSHIVRNYILPSTARTHMTVFSFSQYRNITKRLTCMVVLKQIYWAITPSITKHSIGSSLWIIRIIKRLNPFHIWAWKQREVHQQ